MNPETILIANANAGIGLELIRHILAKPEVPRLLFAGCCPSPVEVKCLEQMAHTHSSLKIVHMDVTKDASIDGAYIEVSNMLGDDGLNLLITNSGVADTEGLTLAKQTRGAMDKYLGICATVPVMLAQKFSPLLMRAAEKKSNVPMGCGRAAIINLSLMHRSIQTSADTMKSYHYRAARAALNTVTSLLAMELGVSGIVVAAIHPGWADTGASENSAQEEELDMLNKLWSTITTISKQSCGMMHNYDGMILPW